MTIELNSLQKDLQPTSSSKVELFSKFKSGYDKTSSLWNQGGLLNRIKAIVTALLETVRNVFVFVPNLCASLANRAQLVFKPEPKPSALPTLSPLISAEPPIGTQPAPAELPAEAPVLLEAPQQPTAQKTADQEQPPLDQPVITPVSTETALPSTAPSDPGCMTKMATWVQGCVKRHPIAAKVALGGAAVAVAYYLGAPASLFAPAASAVIGESSEKAPETVAYAGKTFMGAVQSLNPTRLFSAAPEAPTFGGKTFMGAFQAIQGSRKTCPLPKAPILTSFPNFSAPALNSTASVPFDHTGTCDVPVRAALTSSPNFSAPALNATASVPFDPTGTCDVPVRAVLTSSPNFSAPAANTTASVSVDQINAETCAASSAPSSALGSNSNITTIYRANQGATGTSKVSADFFGSAASLVPPAPTLTPLYNSSMSVTNATVSVPFDHTGMCDAPAAAPILTSLPNDFCEASADPRQFVNRSGFSPNVNNTNNPKQKSSFDFPLKSLIGLGGVLVAGAAYMLEKNDTLPETPKPLPLANKAGEEKHEAPLNLNIRSQPTFRALYVQTQSNQETADKLKATDKLKKAQRIANQQKAKEETQIHQKKLDSKKKEAQDQPTLVGSESSPFFTSDLTKKMAIEMAKLRMNNQVSLKKKKDSQRSQVSGQGKRRTVHGSPWEELQQKASENKGNKKTQ